LIDENFRRRESGGEREVVVEVPPIVRAKAKVAGADAWLRGLSDLVAALESEWGIRVGDVYEDGTEAFVAAVTTGDGTAAVLKLLVPRRSGDADHEIVVLRRCAGEGCVALLRDDPARGALLLERLGPPLSELGLPVDERQEILCATARKVWRPAEGLGLPTGAVKARWLSEWIERAWESLGRPCRREAVDYALQCSLSRERAYDPERAVLVHGDVHQWNALRAGRGFKLVDPDGLMAEPEYDLGIVMREDPTELMAGDPWARAVRLAALTDTDATAIWEWGVVERVSTGLLGAQIGMQPVADQMLRAAELVAALA
jgi:streptomycin 6-kinase